MAGRGGRGMALLQAMEEPARRPGAENQASSQQSSQSMPPKSSGRGSYLLNLIPQTLPPEDSPPTPALSTQPPPLQKSTTQPTGATLPKPSGRGAALLAMCKPSPPRPVREVKPISSPLRPSQSGDQQSSAPTESLSSLRISGGASPPDKVSTHKGKGSGGSRISIASNYVRLNAKCAHWYQYAVTYTPNTDSRGLRFKLLYEHSETIGQARVFDGSILFLPFELPSKVTTFFSMNPYANEQVTVKVSLVRSISISSRQCIQMYNILFNKIMNLLNMVQIGRSACYDAKAAIDIPQYKLQVWPGYVTSVEEYEGGLLLMCDVSHKVLRQETAYDIMSGIFRNANIPPPMKKDACLKALVGQSVITRYNNKTYRVDDIEFDLRPASTFDRREGPISYAQYYRQQYGIEIRDPDQPMLISRPKKVDRKTGEKKEELICLPPELANLTGLTDDMRSNFSLMKSLGAHTKVTPQARQNALKKFIHSVNNSSEARDQLAMWGLELDSDTIRLDARQYRPEEITYGGKTGNAGHRADFTRDATNNRVLNAVDLNNWVLVCITKDQQRAMGYTMQYKKVGQQLGIRVADPTVQMLNQDSSAAYIRAISDKVNEQVQLVVVIFPTKREDRYSAVKKFLCLEKPCPSQIIVSKTIGNEKNLRSVVQKITLQINAKLGGELWALRIPLNNTMFVGIDVYHDGAKGKGKSVAGLVASLNKSATRYYSRVSMQNPGEELIHGLKVCFLAALRKYHEINNVLPDKIIVYRDGVGDSMMDIVADFEVKQLSECFSSFESYNPGLVTIVVKKRINTRLFLVKGRGENALMENVGPGSVLDHTVTKGKWYDFFIVSQHTTQGTVNPTHYVVVYDSTSLTPDNLQQLSYKMCHLYYNWTGTVRVPAPCQYAHKLAYLVGESVKSSPSEHLADKLYYL